MKMTVPPLEQIALVQISPVGTEVVVAYVNMAPPLKKQKKEFGKDIRASSKGVNLEAVEQEALDLATRDPIRLDTQIRSSISQLSVAWKSVAEVLKLATANYGELVRQHNRKQFKKEAAATKQEVEDEVKKAINIAVASRNKLIQAFYFWGLSREDVDLALAGKYGEIIFPGDDASPMAEQTPAPPEVVHLRGKVIEMEKALSRARDSINRTQQVHNKLEYERCLHKSNFDKTFKELLELQCRYGKIKIERDEVLRIETDRRKKSLEARSKDLNDELNKVKTKFYKATLLTTENVMLRGMAMLHADVEKFRTEHESILAATTEYVTEYDLQLAQLSYIDHLMPRVMELLNVPSTGVDAAILSPVLLSSGPGESSNVICPKYEQ
ncbi:hypothetical protein GIB67_020622 [Kingdonia uniflora]|uniref:Uncharacterized protein n=1 Tax=Kingdonia uniflora TaxID=39325 RepID=A0A7J7M930_9MAGN|nr:hypothetical protein GIB67_020622 [Kingdonia uniflora]